ncbi:MAG TPA: DNA-3-methyladenine glycosylase I [Acidimicrobiales bacterium]
MTANAMNQPLDDQQRRRCSWADESAEMAAYHDTEWGFPVRQDRRLFEKICLEGFQSGLSWRTILAKRPAFRHAFKDFDIATVATYGEDDVQRLLGDAGIIRHRGKIEATINNARQALVLIEERGSLADYVWSFEPSASSRPTTVTWDWLSQVTTSPEAVALSKDLKRRGWRFVGPTTAYAFMQAMGLVDDHVDTCPVRAQVERARSG